MNQTENLYTPSCIRTYTGKYVNVFEPKPEMFCIEDVAHALSQQPRFGGHLPQFYSVANHCINCSSITEGDRYEALMHDCVEAYLIDLPKPIKMGISQYQEIEDSLMKVLSSVFHFNYPFSEDTKNVDKAMLEVEWHRLMLSNEKDMYIEPTIYNIPECRHKFLELYNLLKP